MAVDMPISGPLFTLLQAAQVLSEHGAQMLTVKGVEKGPQRIGFQNRLDPKKGFKMVAVLNLAQLLLVWQ